MQRFNVLILLAVQTLLWAGCSGSDPKLGTVEGTVTLNGARLDQGDIVFRDPNGQISGAGGKVVQGSYSFQCSPASMRVEIRDYRVVPGKFDESNPGVKVPLRAQYLPAKYNDASELTADVKPGHNQFNFELVSEEN